MSIKYGELLLFKPQNVCKRSGRIKVLSNTNKVEDGNENKGADPLRGKKSVTPSGVSTALARSSLIFRNAVRSQEIPDVFLEKAPVTASSQRPRRCYRALVAFVFLRSSCWRFYVLSRRFHCIFTALTLRALRCHGVRTALSRRLHCTVGVTSQKSMQISGTVAIGI